MKRCLPVLFALAVAVVLVPAGAHAHFQLVEPPPWIVMNALGDPQKVGPCGGNPNGDNSEILSGIVTEVTGGSKLPLKIQETIFHSGHYRVALSVNSRNELPADPTAVEKYTDRGLYSVWGVIQSPPQVPVLADGLFRHYPEGTSGRRSGRRPRCLPGKPTSTSRTSTARSARCRSSSSWPITCTTSRAATPIITAPT